MQETCFRNIKRVPGYIQNICVIIIHTLSEIIICTVQVRDHNKLIMDTKHHDSGD